MPIASRFSVGEQRARRRFRRALLFGSRMVADRWGLEDSPHSSKRDTDTEWVIHSLKLASTKVLNEAGMRRHARTD